MIPRHLIIGVAVMLAIALGMSFYAWRMRRNVAEPESAYTHPVAPPVLGPTEQVTLYVAYDDPGVIHAQSATIPLSSGRQQRAQELLRALLEIYLDKSSPHRLGAGADLRDVYLVDPGPMNPSFAVIDVNGAFANGHRSGILVETLTVASLVQTLAANLPGISRVKILVDGKARETLAGHADLSNFYDVSAIGQMSAQLSAGQ